ncbi:MAG: hypothetical protein HY854_18460 [Burkholderiales bacterium]|nr:hypothetical protein [Burkholderiales bacterium]
MKSLIALAIAAVFGTSAFAAGHPAEAQVSGSEGPKAKAEARHLAKKHGLKPMQQPEAQAPGSVKAQARAEEIHLKKKHGNVNPPSEEAPKKDASRL